MTDGVTTAVPGGSVTYTITASNAGPSNVTGATVADTFPASLTATWTAVGAGGGTATASGSGNINDTVNLPAGGSVTYTVSATISPSTTGTLSNTATVAAPGGVTDPTPGNNSATDSDTLAPQADLAITKTDGVTTATPTGTITYTITASNAGPSNAPGATVADTLPASLTATWTAVGAGGGTATASGSGNINDTVNLPAGGSVTYTVTATLASTASGTLSNTATVTAPGGVTDPTPGNNSATDTDTVSTVVSITALDASADENTGDTGAWRITRNTTSGDLVVQLAIDASSTASETEWSQTGATFSSLAAGSTGTVTIPNGSSFVDITLTPVDDAAAEAGETVRLNIASDGAYTVINPMNAIVSIEANDFVVTNLSDSGEGSLRQAVANANNIAGAHTVTFDAAVTGTIALVNGQMTIGPGDITVQGPGADVLSVSGSNLDRVFVIYGNVAVSGLTIREGAALGGSGGGIYVGANSNASVTACTITNNTAASGGGIHNTAGTLAVRNSTIVNNTATDSGGGLQSGSDQPSSGSVTLQNCTITGNTAGTAGYGGGAVTGYHSLIAKNCTFYGNSANYGGNLADAGGSITLGNTIVAGGILIGQNGSAPDVSANPTSLGNNLIGDGTGIASGPTNGINGDQVGTAASPINPLLGALANNGGPTLTLKPSTGSPAANAGNNAIIPADDLDLDDDSNTTEAVPFDQRGAGFPRVRGATVDIGAIEGNQPPTITLPPVLPIVVEATKPEGADVTFTITAIDAEDGDLTMSLVVNHLSGSTFALGDTPVNVSVTDSDGATTTDSFTVTVQDTTPPVIEQHDNIEVVATMITGTEVTFTANVTDAVGATVSFDPPSGSTFPLGVTTVTITAEDAAQHVVTSTFTVTVRLDKPVNTPTYVTGGPVIGATGGPGAPPVDAKWASFGSPAIDENGHVTFVSSWSSTTGGKGTGLFTDAACVAIVGGPVPDVTGAKFKSFTGPVIHNGRVASIVGLSGVSATTASGILTVTVAAPPPSLPEGPQSIAQQPQSDAALVARAGDVATADGAKFKSFKSVDVRGTTTGFAASLTVGSGSPKTTAATDGGVWIASPSVGPRLILREGQTVGARKIASLTTFDSSAGSRGQGRGWFELIGGTPSAQARVVYTDRKQAILSSGLVGTTVTTDSLIATGDIFSGGYLVTNGFGLPAVNSLGQFALIASTDSETGPRQGIEVQLDGETFERIAVRLGATPLAGAFFASLQDPVLSGDGAVAFPAKLKGTGIKGAAANSLWWQPSGGSLTLLARGGGAAGGVPHDLPTGAQWAGFSSLAIAADRGPIFAGTLVVGKGGVTTANASGVWAVDYQGKLRTLFRTNDSIDLGNNITKKLKSFNVLTPTVGNTGVTRSHNGAHEITWLATFTDKTQAIIVTTVP